MCWCKTENFLWVVQLSAMCSEKQEETSTGFDLEQEVASWYMNQDTCTSKWGCARGANLTLHVFLFFSILFADENRSQVKDRVVCGGEYWGWWAYGNPLGIWGAKCIDFDLSGLPKISSLHSTGRRCRHAFLSVSPDSSLYMKL